MITPRNSVNETFPAGPLAMQPVQKVNLKRMSSVVGPTQSFFMRESKALGAVQIMNGLFHIALGGLLMIPTGVYVPICVSVWYPLWGGIMFIISGSLLAAAEKTFRKSLVKMKVLMNSLSLFAAISGIILLIMDILNITISHFLKLEGLNLIKTPVPYINIYNCGLANPSGDTDPSTQYCYNIQSVFLGIFSVMLIFAFFQNLVTAGIVENEWKKMCSRPKDNVVLLSAEDKKEQTIKIKEEIIELTEVSSQPKNEEDIEIIPVQEEEERELNFPEHEENIEIIPIQEEEEEEEREMNFPEPPQDQESSTIETESSP